MDNYIVPGNLFAAESLYERRMAALVQLAV